MRWKEDSKERNIMSHEDLPILTFWGSKQAVKWRDMRDDEFEWFLFLFLLVFFFFLRGGSLLLWSEFYFYSIFVRNWGWRLSGVIDNLKAFNNDNLLHCYCLFYNAWLIRGLGWRRKPKPVSSFLIILLCLSLIMLNDLIGSPSWMLFNFWFCKGYLECLLLFMLDLDISCLG